MARNLVPAFPDSAPESAPSHRPPSSCPALGASSWRSRRSPSAGEIPRTSPKNLERTHCNLAHPALWRRGPSVLPIVSHKVYHTILVEPGLQPFGYHVGFTQGPHRMVE